MLAPSTTMGEAPMQKAYSGMVHFSEEEEHLLFVVGGYGHAGLSLPQLGAQYYQLPQGYVRTNEENIFSLSTNRWSSVAVTGQAPSPCSSFTLTKVGEKRAAMFGGWSGSDTSNDLLFVELGRYYVLNSLPKAAIARCYHSVSVFHLGDRCVWIVIFGGSPYIADTTIIELVQGADDEWSVEEVMQKDILSNKTVYLERLKLGRIKGRIKASLDGNKMLEELEQKIRTLQGQLLESEQALISSQRRTKEVEEEKQLLSIQFQGALTNPQERHDGLANEGKKLEEKDIKDGKFAEVSYDQQSLSEHDTLTSPRRVSSPHQVMTEEVIQAYDVSLRASKKREQELKEELTAAQHAAEEKDKQCSKLENELYDMYKKMVAAKDDYEQTQKLLEQKKSLIANEEEQQEVFKLLEQTKRMGYAKDLQISMLENDGQQLLEKIDQLKRKNQILEDKLCSTFAATKPWSTMEAGVQANYLAIAPDFLRGVEVYKETVLEIVGDLPQKVEWPGYGFFIEVPEGAVPPGVTVSVGVKVILAGQFQFPENRQLISAIYWISSSIAFLKEVSVNIQHCAVAHSEDQCSQFKFIIAKCSQKELPYTFREREGLFNSHTPYGAIKLKQFSILGQTAPEDTDVLCTALMFYKQRIATPLTIVFHFVVVRDLEPFLQKVKENYEKWSEDLTTFEKLPCLTAHEQLSPSIFHVIEVFPKNVKPSNILMSAKGEFKLCDFGISGKLVDSIAKTMEVGCRPYMAPERIDPFRASQGYTIQSDVWSFGITLVELALGSFPYGKWKTIFDQLNAVVSGPPPTIPEDGRFSPMMVEFVAKCLIKDPSERPDYVSLQKHPFLVRSASEQVDVVGWYRNVMSHRKK